MNWVIKKSVLEAEFTDASNEIASHSVVLGMKRCGQKFRHARHAFSKTALAGDSGKGTTAINLLM